MHGATLKTLKTLPHVSTPRCYHQGAYQKQMFVVPTHNSGAIRPHFYHKS